MHSNQSSQLPWSFLNPPQIISTSNNAFPQNNGTNYPIQIYSNTVIQSMIQSLIVNATETISNSARNPNTHLHFANQNEPNRTRPSPNGYANSNIAHVNYSNLSTDNSLYAIQQAKTFGRIDSASAACSTSKYLASNESNTQGVSSKDCSSSSSGAVTEMMSTILQFMNKRVQLPKATESKINSENHQEESFLKKMLCFLIRQMVDSKIIMDGSIVKQFLQFLEEPDKTEETVMAKVCSKKAKFQSRSNNKRYSVESDLSTSSSISLTNNKTANVLRDCADDNDADNDDFDDFDDVINWNRVPIHPSEKHKTDCSSNNDKTIKSKIGPAFYKARLIKKRKDEETGESSKKINTFEYTSINSSHEPPINTFEYTNITNTHEPPIYLDTFQLKMEQVMVSTLQQKNDNGTNELTRSASGENIFENLKRKFPLNVSNRHLPTDDEEGEPLMNRHLRKDNNKESLNDAAEQMEQLSESEAALEILSVGTLNSDIFTLENFDIGKTNSANTDMMKFLGNTNGDKVRTLIQPNLNNLKKPALKIVYFGSVKLRTGTTIDWLHMIYREAKESASMQCVFCHTVFKLPFDFLDHVNVEHSDLLFAVGKQIPLGNSIQFFIGCRHCSYQTYDVAMMMIHFEVMHGLTDISDGSKLSALPLLPVDQICPIILKPGDKATAEVGYSCFDCELLATGTNSHQWLSNHVLNEHSATEHHNGCFVRMMRFSSPPLGTRATYKQVTKADLYSSLRTDMYCCVYCDFQTTCNYEALAHNITAHLVKKILYVCPYCNTEYLLSARLIEHISRRHVGMDPFYCTVTIIEGGEECFIQNRGTIDL